MRVVGCGVVAWARAPHPASSSPFLFGMQSMREGMGVLDATAAATAAACTSPGLGGGGGGGDAEPRGLSHAWMSLWGEARVVTAFVS